MGSAMKAEGGRCQCFPSRLRNQDVTLPSMPPRQPKLRKHPKLTRSSRIPRCRSTVRGSAPRVACWTRSFPVSGLQRSPQCLEDHRTRTQIPSEFPRQNPKASACVSKGARLFSVVRKKLESALHSNYSVGILKGPFMLRRDEAARAHFRSVGIGLACALLTTVGTSAQDAGQRLARARRLGRPVFALGSSTSCSPCRRMHATIQSDPRVRRLLAQFEVVLADTHSPDFGYLSRHFGVDASLVPMVYVVDSEGELRYGQSGGLSGDQLVTLLTSVIPPSAASGSDVDPGVRRLSRTSASNPQASAAGEQGSLGLPHPTTLEQQTLLRVGRDQARRGQLIQALSTIAPLAQPSLATPEAAEARIYEAKLVEAIEQWIQDLDGQIDEGRAVCGAAYRIAEIYVELPNYPSLRAMTGNILERRQQSPATSLAVEQAKRLLRARIYEDHEKCEEAMADYQRVLAINASNEAADYARERMAALAEFAGRKLASGTRESRASALP